MSQQPRNPNNEPPRKKRRWYYKLPNNEPPVTTSNTNVPRPDIAKQREKEKAENEENVTKMEQKLHEYFQKSNMPYSYLDDTGIYKYTPKVVPPPATTAAASTSTNPFMNLTYTPSLFSNQQFPNIWTTIIPFQLPSVPVAAPAAAPAAALDSTTVPSPPSLAQPEYIDIRENIQHIDDLIALCDKYPLSETKKYNINMVAIHAIREPLTDLSNMIGMDTIKRTIVDQILYFLQDLHIPEKNIQDKPVKESGEEKANPLNPFATPFTFPNPFASSSASGVFEFKPMNIKNPPPWANGGGGGCGGGVDDFASPTKGDFMHTVIYGPPGSGKTEVAKIIGRIFSNLGILTKKIFKKVSRNDLVAGYLGQTAIKTKDMIKATLGGVLFIDEAYSLGNTEKRDSFAKECVDTLCEALSEHKHNWMVIIAGYEKELNNCFFSLNEGLNSRFTWRFKLDAYKPGELKSIYEKQVRDYGWTIAARTGATEIVPESWFASRMDYFTTYGRDMETLFTKTKIAHSRRVFCLPTSEKKMITMEDLENGFKLFIENPEVKDRKENGGGGPYTKTLYL